MSANNPYLQKVLSSLAPARKKTASPTAEARQPRTIISFIEINTMELKTNFNVIQPGILTLVETHEYFARGEDANELDGLSADFFRSGGEDGKGGSLSVKSYENLPGHQVNNLNALYGDWGLTEIEALRDVRDPEEIMAVQLAIFPEGPDAFPRENLYRVRAEYLRDKMAHAEPGSLLQAVLADVLRAHTKMVQYRRRWAQRVGAEAQEAQTKNGKSGRTFLETFEADVFIHLGEVPPGFMNVRYEGEDFIPTVKVADAAPVTDPALTALLAQSAKSQEMMAMAISQLVANTIETKAASVKGRKPSEE
jgi:hypothetical protein